MDTGTWPQLNRATYVNRTSSLVEMIDYSVVTQAKTGISVPQFAYDSDLFGFTNMTEAVQLQDVGVYKDSSET